MSTPTVTPSGRLTTAQKKVVMERIISQKVIPASSQMAALPQIGNPSQQNSMSPMIPSMPNRGLPPMGNTDSMPIQSDPAFNPVPSEEQVIPDIMETRVATGNVKNLSETDKRIQYSLIADQIWTSGGGSDSAQGDIWNKLKRTSGRTHLESGRDYFISCFIKYREDPNGFTKKHPREGRIVAAVNEAFETAQDESMIPADIPQPIPQPSTLPTPPLMGGSNGIA